MAEKYVVSILRKNQIDENNYMFNYQQFLVGEIDDFITSDLYERRRCRLGNPVQR